MKKWDEEADMVTDFPMNIRIAEEYRRVLDTYDLPAGWNFFQIHCNNKRTYFMACDMSPDSIITMDGITATRLAKMQLNTEKGLRTLFLYIERSENKAGEK